MGHPVAINCAMPCQARAGGCWPSAISVSRRGLQRAGGQGGDTFAGVPIEAAARFTAHRMCNLTWRLDAAALRGQLQAAGRKPCRSWLDQAGVRWRPVLARMRPPGNSHRQAISGGP